MRESSTPTGEDKLAVIIATAGRPQFVAILLKNLAQQTRRPDAIFVIGASEADVAGLEPQQGVTIAVGRRGLTLQRNDGLALAGDRYATIVFFDDDFVPSRYWIEKVAALFAKYPDVISLTGDLLADGVTASSIALEEAITLVAAKDSENPRGDGLREGFGPYGCNMAFRAAAIAGTRFDERLPLYGWLEDCDFGGMIKDRGRLMRADALWGVHLGHKTGRARGVTLGYSQIANAVYIARKGRISSLFLAKIAFRNVLKNLLRAANPEPMVDRKGRLFGNLIGLLDIMRGRITPERAAKL